MSRDEYESSVPFPALSASKDTFWKENLFNDYCDVCKKYDSGMCRKGCSVVGYGGGFCLAKRRNTGNKQ